MTDIYKQHDAAFRGVSAYVIMAGSERVATIAFKFPSDGAGRLYAYVHFIGTPMARGFASGYGYDKCSAACESAMEKFKPLIADFGGNGGAPARRAFCTALENICGSDWKRRLEDAGFNVFQAV